jgi:hypothetical protein
MSLNAQRFQARSHPCTCGRPAVYFSHLRRRPRARKDHPLCTRCFRSLLAGVRSGSGVRVAC